MGKDMKKRFEGEEGHRLLIEVLREQRIVGGNEELAEDLSVALEIVNVATGKILIEQGSGGNDMFFIFAGTFDVVVNGRKMANRGPGDHVGEMAAIQPLQLRAASVIATCDGVVGVLTEPKLTVIGKAHPEIWRWMAKELSRRLLQRNRMVADARSRIRIFIISSAEAIDIARAVQNSFEHDAFTVVVWTNDVFKASYYPIETLENELDISDFAIAIVQADDVVKTRGKKKAVPRDNVIFELGFFMGRLGRQRAILMEPRGTEVKLPTDLAGITTIPYKATDDGGGLAVSMAPACNRLRTFFKEYGPL